MTFEIWLNAQMASRGIRSARRLALEAGLESDHVADWVLGTGVPSDDEAAKLATYLGVDAGEVMEARFPKGSQSRRD